MDPYTCAKVRHDPPRALIRFRACVTLRTKSVYSAIFFRFSVFFLGGGFLQLATAKAPRSILTQSMPKQAVPRKDVPFRGRDHKI